MNYQFLRAFLAGGLTLWVVHAQAADIDLFAGVPIDASDGAQILFVLDNAANFSSSVTELRCSITAAGTAAGVVDTSGNGTAPTALDKSAGAVEQCALYAALSAVNANADGAAINIGVMGFNANGMKQFDPRLPDGDEFSASCVGGTGGCLLMPLVPFNDANKTKILEWIRRWETSGGSDYNMKGNNTANGAVMQEAWAYFLGKTGVSGRSYSAVAPAVGCADRNIIFIGNAVRNNATPGDGTNEANSPLKPLMRQSSDSTKWADPAATTKQKTIITDSIKTICSAGNTTLETAEGKGVYALNWARYMKQAHTITTFSIGVLGSTCNAEYAAHLAKLGSDEVGGGGFYPSNDFDELSANIGSAVGKIQAKNSVFAAVSLPVSVNTQGLYLNQVYIGMFRPHASFLPRWNGNLKQYKLGLESTSGNLRLEDADSTGAINNLTGFIGECARSFWTPSTTDSYWEDAPSGECTTATSFVKTPTNGNPTEAEMHASNTPDGNIVEKGAQAYKLRAIAPADRTVKTCSPVFASCTAMTPFDTDNTAITQALLNAGGSDRATLINWARGQNVDNELTKGTTVIRPSVHGDIVHSRPVPVNHGTDQIVVYYGGNDGMLRAINGNRSASITSGGKTFLPGAEMWSFMPPEFYGRIKRLHSNSPAISYPLTSSTTSPGEAKDYGFDGPFTTFQGEVDGVNKTYVYGTMRRGGRAIYAFDVTTPGTPSLLWKKGCPNLLDDTSCTNSGTDDFRGIGQTWSSLKATYAANYESGTKPMLITGGGYENCEDDDAGATGGKNHNCSSTSGKGHKVYVLNASTGAIVRAFDTLRSVVADATIVLDTVTGKAKYAYTADLGGNVYRINFAGSTAADWTLTRIAALGCATPAACTDSVANRKFMFAPSVVTTDGSTFQVLLGSGDREKPILQYAAASSVTNHFFMLTDRPTDAGWLTSENSNCGANANVLCLGSLLGITVGTTPSAGDLASKKGWFLNLTSTEQVVTSAVTIFGVTTFSTHQPPVTANACTNGLGTTRVYNVSYLNASSPNGSDPIFERVVGDSLPPSPVAGMVTLDDGSTVPFCIGCGGNSPLEAKIPGVLSSVSRPTNRLYWYIKK